MLVGGRVDWRWRVAEVAGSGVAQYVAFPATAQL